MVSMSRLMPLALVALHLACVSTPAPGINAQNDAFASWGAPPPTVVVTSDQGDGEGAITAAEMQSAWLAKPADWRTFDAERLEAEIYRLTNREREAADVRLVTFNPALTSVARGHSVEMALIGSLSHTSPMNPRLNIEDRVSVAGLAFRAVAENVASEPLVRATWDSGRQDFYTWQEVASATIRHWRESEPHRLTMVRKDLREVGIGAALSTIDGDVPRVFVTQDFLR